MSESCEGTKSKLLGMGTNPTNPSNGNSGNVKVAIITAIASIVGTLVTTVVPILVTKNKELAQVEKKTEAASQGMSELSQENATLRAQLAESRKAPAGLSVGKTSCQGNIDATKSIDPFTIEIQGCTTTGIGLKCKLRVENHQEDRANMWINIRDSRVLIEEQHYPTADGRLGTAQYNPSSGHVEVTEDVDGKSALTGEILFDHVPSSAGCVKVLDLIVSSSKQLHLSFGNIPITR